MGPELEMLALEVLDCLGPFVHDENTTVRQVDAAGFWIRTSTRSRGEGQGIEKKKHFFLTRRMREGTAVFVSFFPFAC